MNIRWLIGIYARPEDAPSRRVASQASTLAHQRYVSPSQFWGFTALAILLPVGVLFKLLPWAVASMGFAQSNMANTIAIACVCLFVWPWSAWMYRYLYRGPVQQALRDLGQTA